jgi:hypothetical protein
METTPVPSETLSREGSFMLRDQQPTYRLRTTGGLSKRRLPNANELPTEVGHVIDWTDEIASADPDPFWTQKPRLTLLDVLRRHDPNDARCWITRAYRSGSGYTGACRGWKCEKCAPMLLRELITRALDAWDDQPVVVIRGREAWEAFRARHEIKLAGPHATPNVVVVPGYDDELTAFVPMNGGIRGRDLALALYQALLRMPVRFKTEPRSDPDATPNVITFTGLSAEAVRSLITWDVDFNVESFSWRPRVTSTDPDEHRPTEEQWQMFILGIRRLLALAPPLRLAA